MGQLLLNYKIFTQNSIFYDILLLLKKETSVSVFRIYYKENLEHEHLCWKFGLQPNRR
jgi:putative IMPACT (imprinted ancient) family translation regulator